MIGRDSLWKRIRQFVAKPDTFFQQLVASPVEYRWPLAIVIATGLCGGIMAWIIHRLDDAGLCYGTFGCRKF